MEAVICHDYNEATVESVPRPVATPDEVVVEVDRVQLSVTECQVFTGALEDDVRRDAMRRGDARLFGHEFCGRVVETAGDGSDWDIGDRVYSTAKTSCNVCPLCRSGYRRLCPDKVLLGRDRPGALAEYVACPSAALVGLPEAVSPAEGAAMQPLSSSLGYVRNAPLETGDVVVVLGAGVMGYQCGQAALLHGAGTVIVVDRNPEKLALARQRGMVGIDVNETSPADRVRELTDGVGADVVFEAIGGEQSHGTSGEDPLAMAYRIVRPGGSIVEVGTIIGEVTVSPGALADKHVTLVNMKGDPIDTGPNGDTGELAPELVAAGRISIADYVTHELDGLEAFDRAVEITGNKGAFDALGPPQLVLTHS